MRIYVNMVNPEPQGSDYSYRIETDEVDYSRNCVYYIDNNSNDTLHLKEATDYTLHEYSYDPNLERFYYLKKNDGSYTMYFDKRTSTNLGGLGYLYFKIDQQ